MDTGQPFYHTGQPVLYGFFRVRRFLPYGIEGVSAALKCFLCLCHKLQIRLAAVDRGSDGSVLRTGLCLRKSFGQFHHEPEASVCPRPAEVTGNRGMETAICKSNVICRNGNPRSVHSFRGIDCFHQPVFHGLLGIRRVLVYCIGGCADNSFCILHSLLVC